MYSVDQSIKHVFHYTLPGRVFLLYGLTDAFSTLSSPQMLFHTLHKHELAGHGYVDVSSLLNCHGTFWCIPITIPNATLTRHTQISSKCRLFEYRMATGSLHSNFPQPYYGKLSFKLLV